MSTSADTMWQPSPARIARSNLQRFIRTYADEIGGDDYAACLAWSVARPDQFWGSVWDFCGLVGDRGSERVVVDPDKMPGARWFPDASLNFAENLLRPRRDGVAIIFANELGMRRELSWDELRSRVAAVATGLLGLGVGPGDRVAGLLPNLPETAIAMLATTSIGAVWTSCSPDFGHSGVLDRFGQTRPKVLFATDGYVYAGKRIDCTERVRLLAEQLPQLAAVVVVSYATGGERTSKIAKAVSFDSLADESAAAAREWPRFPFSHPAYVLYTSGTTGIPKSIIHSAGGTLLQHVKEHVLHTDINPGERIFYFTTCGWMMWNWLMSALASSATLVLFDGMPLHPDPGVLWRLAEAESVSVFGTSAKYLAALEKSGYRPAERHGLQPLRCVLSTGSPLPATSFDYVYRHIKTDLQLSSIAGGTDLISCFALGNPILPVRRGELQCVGLGMKVDIFDDDGRPLRGSKGELVCTAPFPSMPLGFWNDPGDAKYRATYFERFPGTWCHGDYAELTDHGGLILYGRSDTVLNPGGVRIGTAEIYRIVDDFPEILESVAVGQNCDGDERIVLFVKMQPGRILDSDLTGRIRLQLRERASPRHVPAVVLEVGDIPRTLSGKIVEVAVRDAVNGRAVANVGALANPAALDWFRNRPELAQ